MTFKDQQLRDELQVLCEAVINSDATEEQMRRLEVLIRQDKSSRTYYVGYMRQHALLLERYHRLNVPTISRLKTDGTRVSPTRFAKRFAFSLTILLVGIVFAGFFFARDRVNRIFTASFHEQDVVSNVPASHDDFPATFGTLHISSPHLVWGGSETPIENGARVGRRMIHLIEGTVQIRYDDGVCLKIEGPAKIELSRLGHCFLYSGNVLARVSSKGVGFTIDTYSASIEDHGTEFSVFVQDENNSAVRVLNGHVEVRPAGDDSSIPLKTGKEIRFSDCDAGHDNAKSDPSEKKP